MKINKFNEEHRYGSEYEEKINKQEKVKELINKSWNEIFKIKNIGITEYFPGTSTPHYSITINMISDINKKTYLDFFKIFDFLNEIKSVIFFNIKDSSFAITSINLDELIENLEAFDNSKRYNL